jgi:antitoxin YefM
MKAISTLIKRMKEIFEYALRSTEVIIVPRNNNEEAIVIMSIQEYNSLKETEHLFSTEANQKKLQKSIGQISEGKTVKFTI